MSNFSYKFETSNRTLIQRLFEQPRVGAMSPVSKVVAYSMLIFWSLFVLFPIYWVIITSFKLPQYVQNGPHYLPFVDYPPSLHAWRSVFTEDPYCDAYAIGRQLVLLGHNLLAWVASPFVTIQPMEPQICRIYLAYVNSLVIGISSTALCIVIGSMAAYALARIQYKPKFGNILMFIGLALLAVVATALTGIAWYFTILFALVLFFLLARAYGKHFKNTLGNGDILFWIISQRILPPIVIVIPVYMMFQSVGIVDTHIGLIIIYAVANLPIVVWLMHDFFVGLPIELEESAQLDGSTRFGIFWEIVLPLTKPGLAAVTLLTLILNWNEYLFAVFLTITKAQTMPIMVASMNAGDRGVLWWSMCAIILVMIVPVIIMAIILQRYIAKGVLLGAVKG
jgi:multiple sugar transport system permease protein